MHTFNTLPAISTPIYLHVHDIIWHTFIPLQGYHMINMCCVIVFITFQEVTLKEVTQLVMFISARNMNDFDISVHYPLTVIYSLFTFF